LSLRHNLSMASFHPEEATPAFVEFVTERHLAVLTLVRPSGRPHSTPVGFTWDQATRLARVITWSGSMKSRLLEAGELAGTICQVDGGRWVTVEGPCSVTGEPVACADAVARYAARYTQPKDRGPERRVITMAVERILASGGLCL
tara:strand:- start:1118 stop:1552 length:435 start_codon:yes stop_codon:yes gene_type:complete